MVNHSKVNIRTDDMWLETGSNKMNDLYNDVSDYFDCTDIIKRGNVDKESLVVVVGQRTVENERTEVSEINKLRIVNLDNL